MNLVAIRLLNQQLASPLFLSPAEVVSFMGAVQAQGVSPNALGCCHAHKEPLCPSI